ncbi:antitoxin component YwqK of YwqJK toxin-antitoxin module [Variovorax paradoxus]|uniref:toxin-antitoxin system YwqK family antitoxin n=1 Tax=Variovorax atrisoli TaxID=3394203 RepID=UPI00119A57FE|nr:hypothetical protein [Variovorax paradoxus]MDR6524361.1 antitoxin component YwqK of YwqJK toxin-antitoxin module [Variovorax paradoxus]
MKHILKALAAPCMAVAAAFLMAACSPSTLDFRNAEVVNGKIFRAGADKPYSGHITNVPERTVLVGRKDYAPYQQSISNAYLALGIRGGYYTGQALCDVDVKKGLFDGRATCRSDAGQFLAYEVSFDEGRLDGPIKTYYQRKEGRLAAEGNYDKGVLNGPLKVYGPAAGRLILQANFKEGKSHGKEELFDEDSGKLFSRLTYVNGTVNGEIVRYAHGTDRLTYRANAIDGLKDGVEEEFDYFSGKLAIRREWRKGKQHGDAVAATLDEMKRPTDELKVVARFDNGVEVPLAPAIAPTPASGTPNVQGCVDTRIVTFRIQHGEDEVITADQLGEWEAQCRSGKRPG